MRNRAATIPYLTIPNRTVPHPTSPDRTIPYHAMPHPKPLRPYVASGVEPDKAHRRHIHTAPSRTIPRQTRTDLTQPELTVPRHTLPNQNAPDPKPSRAKHGGRNRTSPSNHAPCVHTEPDPAVICRTKPYQTGPHLNPPNQTTPLRALPRHTLSLAGQTWREESNLPEAPSAMCPYLPYPTRPDRTAPKHNLPDRTMHCLAAPNPKDFTGAWPGISHAEDASPLSLPACRR